MTELIWEDPPPPAVRGGHIEKARENDATVEQLKTRPGVWAKVATGIHKSGGQAFTQRGCEATIRKQPDGTFWTYARWPEHKAG